MRRLPWRTALIAAVIAAQLSTFATGSVAWPFLMYCMYAHTRPEPPRTTRTDYVAVLVDGREVVADPVALGYGFWVFDREVHGPIKKGDHAPVAELVRRLEREFGAPVVSIRREIQRHTVVGGAIEVERETLAVYPSPDAGAGVRP